MMTSPAPTRAYSTDKGRPSPLGALVGSDGTNFALYARHASAVTLCLFQPGQSTPFHEIALDPKIHRTGDIWHLLVRGLPKDLCYAYRIDGPTDAKFGLAYDPSAYLLDPYARAVCSHQKWSQPQAQGSYRPIGAIVDDRAFDWQGVEKPGLELKDLIIYEMHTRGFSQDPSSAVSSPGTFSGIQEKIPYLLELGVNAIELLPIQEFNELEYPRSNPDTGEPLVNYWGYSTVNFFAPMSRYAASPDPYDVIHEFKTLVRELHRNGIEVILDVVFNHTAEGNEKGPTFSYRGIDNPDYYMLNSDGLCMNYSGCGNTIDANSPIVRHLILDCLRYWVTEMRVDGFRFDLASILGRDRDGSPMHFSPLIDAISHDPILASSKLIAEAWDAGGLYQVGSFFPEYGRWAEWNGRFRDDVRRFIKGKGGSIGVFATRMTGSEDLYGDHRRPYHSLNFLTAHDGFTLRDLVSYEAKHNWANGENNADGCNENDSWNCGAEGPSADKEIGELRARQMRNFLLAQFTAIGVPMLLMGDEYGHTKEGNNNTWCQDNALNWFDWNGPNEDQGLWRFCRGLIHLRKNQASLRREHFLSEDEIAWYNKKAETPNWNDKDQSFLAWHLKGGVDGSDLYLAFNAGPNSVSLRLPDPPNGQRWHWRVNTGLPSPLDFLEEKNMPPVQGSKLSLIPYSSILLQGSLPD